MFQQKFKLAVVCSSNQNRSMEAHNFLVWVRAELSFIIITTSCLLSLNFSLTDTVTQAALWQI